MRRLLTLIIFFLLFLSLMFGLLAVIIQTDWFWKNALPKYLNRTQGKLIFKEINYDKKNIRMNGEISFSNLKVTIQNDQVYILHLGDLSLKNIPIFFHPEGGKILLEIIGLSVRSTDLEVKNCQLSLGVRVLGFKPGALEGDLSCKELLFSKNSISDFSGRIQGSFDWVAIENITMNYRQGVLSGQATFGLNEVFPYVLDLKFHNVVLDQDVFDGNVMGQVSGVFQANGVAKYLNGFEIVADAPQGTKIKGDLLQSIIPYLPAKSAVKKDLDKIIKIGGYVFCETSHAVIKKTDNNKAVVIVNLKTKKLNLVLNPTIDINIEGGLQSIFNVIEFFSNSDG